MRALILSLLAFAPALALDPSLSTQSAKTELRAGGVSINAASLAALEKLGAISDGRWEVRWDERTGLPARIGGARTEPMGSTPEDAARNFLKEHGRVFGLASAGGDLRAMHVQDSLSGRHVRFLQHVRGVPVHGGDVSVHMDEELRVQAVNSAYIPLPSKLDLTPRVTREQALETARAAARIEGVLRAAASVETVIAPATGSLAWRADLPAVRPLGDFRVLVDAQTGKVLSVENLLRHVKGRLFDPNPVVTLKNNKLRDGNDADGAAFSGAYKELELLGLDSSGKLRGKFVDATLGTNLEEETTANFLFNRSQKGFEQVMVYFHIDRAQRYIQSIGFNNVNNRVQRANAHGTSDDNSWYSPMTKELTFGDGGVDDAEDSDIIMHEYGHSIQDNQVPGFGGRGEAGAMGEAFGDYLASTLRADLSFQPNAVGSWDGTSYSNAAEPCLRRMDSAKKYPKDLEGEVHADGEIWSACLWQIWNKLGKATTDKLVLEHHFLLSPQAKFADGANALLQVDKNLNGGANAKAIKAIFVARGILKSTAKLRVVLKDASTGKPIAGKVAVEGLATVLQSSQTGIIETDVAPGTWVLTASAFGYFGEDGRQVTVEEDQTATIEFSLKPAPRFRVSGTVRRADTGETLAARIIVPETPLDPVQTAMAGTFSFTLPAGKYTLKALAFGFRTGVLENIEVSGPKELEFKLATLPPVLLVDDDKGAGCEKFFAAALPQSDFDVWSVESDGQLAADNMLAYGTVVWLTGADYRETLTEADQSMLRQYVQSGGRLFVSGAELAYSLKDNAFLAEVLGARYESDTAESRKVKGAGHEFAIEGGDGANNQQSPDVVASASEATRELFSYESGGSAALASDRVVFFSFGFEAIATAEQRTAIMKLVLEKLKPTLAERVERLTKFADRDLAEQYEKVLASEIERASEGERKSLEKVKMTRELRALLRNR